MSHITGKSAYRSLEERINRFPQGAPHSETLHKILKMLISEKDAELVAKLPIKPFTVKTASRIWNMNEVLTRKILEELSKNAILLDMDHDGVQEYVLPPPMLGFFEFSLMRTRENFDQKLLSELYHQYLNVEEDFIKDLFLSTETKLGRVLVQEPVLSNDNAVEIMDFERASHVLKTASDISVSMCYCRHKMQHLDKNCDAPMDTCITFGNVANSLSKYGYGRKIDVSEGMEILHRSYEHNLVQCAENVRKDSSFLCNCCGCCCEGMIAARKFGMLHPVQTTSFIPRVVENSCIACGKCVNACPIGAIELVKINDASELNRKRAKINEEICLGCGICVRSCHKNSIFLQRRKEQIITPVNSVHRIVLMAIEKGQLQELIFDNKALASHRAMAAILSTILKLPPIKQAMASKQMKSVYLEKLISKLYSSERQ